VDIDEIGLPTSHADIALAKVGASFTEGFDLRSLQFHPGLDGFQDEVVVIGRPVAGNRRIDVRSLL